MRIRSLQVRSVLAAALAVLIALVVVGIGVDVLVGRHLRRSLDATLRAARGRGRAAERLGARRS